MGGWAASRAQIPCPQQRPPHTPNDNSAPLSYDSINQPASQPANQSINPSTDPSTDSHPSQTPPGPPHTQHTRTLLLVALRGAAGRRQELLLGVLLAGSYLVLGLAHGWLVGGVEVVVVCVLVVWVGRDVLVWGWGRRAASRSSRRMPAHQYLTIQWVLGGAASHPSTTDGRSIDQPRGAAVQSGDALPA